MPLQIVHTFLANYHLANGNYVPFSYKLSSYKLYLCVLFLQIVSICSFLANYYLANCIRVLFFSCSIGLCPMVFSPMALT